MTTLKRIHVDFNTLNSEPVDFVKLAAPGSAQESQLPALEPGERVMLFDSDGLEVEATVVRDVAGWWMAAPNAETWRDAQPTSLSGEESQSPWSE